MAGAESEGKSTEELMIERPDPRGLSTVLRILAYYYFLTYSEKSLKSFK